MANAVRFYIEEVSKSKITECMNFLKVLKMSVE